jgi:hypothetical protein
MTIAAGFHFDGGVLMCSDTELTGPGLTIQDTKISTFACPWENSQLRIAGSRANRVAFHQGGDYLSTLGCLACS